MAARKTMHLNQTDLHTIRKTGELLISEGLARKEDIDAALRIQQRESKTPPMESFPGLSSGVERSQEAYPASPAPISDRRSTIARHLSGLSEQTQTILNENTGIFSTDPSRGDSNIRRTIGRILCDLNLISPIDLSRVLKKYQKQLRLGDILLREGMIDTQQLEDALHEQQRHLEPLGHILIRKGRIDIDGLYSGLSLQYNIPYRQIQRFRYSGHQKSELIRIIGKDYAEANQILPFSLEGTKLTLAVYIPEKMVSIHELRKGFAYLRMECILIRPDAFQDLFTQLYGAPFAFNTTDTPAPVNAIVSSEDSKTEGVSSAQAPEYQPEAKPSQLVNNLLKQAINARATSVHIEQDFRGPTLRFRINGLLETLNLPGLQDRFSETADAIVNDLKIKAGLDKAETRIPQQGFFLFRIGTAENTEVLYFEVRVATMPTVYGENATLLIFDARASDLRLDHLQHSAPLLSQLKKVLDEADGILLLSGPPGSGKRMSLYAAASYLSRPEIKIMAIEETVRHRRSGIVQVQVEKGLNLGADTLLRMAPNHDPDVVLVESLRDAETAEAVFDVAPKGPFILSAMIAEDAVDALMRLRAFGIDPHRIAQSLKAILAQRRLRKICHVCKENYQPDPDDWRAFSEADPSRLSFYRGSGCKSCRYTGYDGWIVVSEFLIVDDALVALLQKGADAFEVRRMAIRSGFKTMTDDALLKLNHTTIQELLKSGLHRLKRSDPPQPEEGSAPDHAEFPAGPEPDDVEKKIWTIGSPERDVGAVNDMYETYRRLKDQTDNKITPVEAGLFHEFIAASFHHICRHYRCSQVRFCIETSGGRPEITANPA